MRNNLKLVVMADSYEKKGCAGTCTVEPKSTHPNKMPFKGTLLIVDEPSTKPPNGSEGHRIMVPKSVAQAKLDSIIGMGLNYAQDLQGHAPRRKIGVITGAWIEGNKVQVIGHVFSKDFPEAERDLKRGQLGMSMELADVTVRDKDAAVWYLEDFHFTGATVLYKDSAAYYKTALSAEQSKEHLYQTALTAASEALDVFQKGENTDMPAENRKKTVLKTKGELLTMAIAAAVGPAVQKAVEAAVKPIEDKVDSLAASISEKEELNELAASAEEEEDDDIDASAEEDEDDIEAGAEEEDMSAKKKKDKIKAKKADKKEVDDEENDDDEDDVDAALEDLKKSGMKNELADGDEDAEPGKLNKTTKNKGNKTTVSASANVLKTAKALVTRLKASNDKLREKLSAEKGANKELTSTVETMTEQIEASAESINRRTIPPEVTMLLAKGGHDAKEMMAGKEKLSVQQVDEMFAESGLDMSITDRMKFKNILLEKGLMDEGRVTR